jgi:hypothetical protein
MKIDKTILKMTGWRASNFNKYSRRDNCGIFSQFEKQLELSDNFHILNIVSPNTETISNELAEKCLAMKKVIYHTEMKQLFHNFLVVTPCDDIEIAVNLDGVNIPPEKCPPAYIFVDRGLVEYHALMRGVDKQFIETEFIEKAKKMYNDKYSV